VPERLTVCGLPLALSAILSEPVSVPAMEGVNITTIVHLAPAATEPPHVLLCSKSLELVPVIVRLVMFRVALPVLLRVTLGDVLVTSMGWLPKPRLVVERLTRGLATVKFSGLEAPPPGPGFVTTTA